MHAAADRPEFAPPPQPGLLRAFVLAVLAHLLLILALTHGLHWQREVQDAAVEAELWSALPQEAAPKAEPVPVPAPPPPPPPPVVKAQPQPEPPVKTDADIALEREKERRLAEQKRHAEEKRLAELEKQRERAKAEAQKKREEELARKKDLQQKQLAEAKKKEEDRKAKLQQQAALEEKKRQMLRDENMKRMQGLAGGGTGAANAQGTAARASGPSASWAGRVQARVRPNIVFPDNIAGNPQAVVEVRIGPGGLIVGKPRLVKSSGVPSWDEAVLRALERTESLPPDTDGRYPSPVEITFRPKA
jgi:colicin import membrane protein